MTTKSIDVRRLSAWNTMSLTEYAKLPPMLRNT
jgi:hypothetical protein